MQTRRLGNSDLDITPIGFGSWAIGGTGYAFAWGPQDDQESIEAIHRALDMGVSWIDTAAVYGLGHSEDVVARAVAIAWTLRLPAVTGAIVGARSAEQVKGVMGSGDFRLSDEEIARIEALPGGEGGAGNRE
jgi:aryl-alcohol dehydrogenase-like predicted oxidoreductase